MKTLFYAGAVLLTAGMLHGAPRISEFLALNKGPLTDDRGLTSDWIEIHNPGPGLVDLNGWALTDEPDLAAKWTFPAVPLEPGAYLVVYASGLDRRETATPLHANFTLAGGGEYLALVPPGAAAVSSFAPYPKQFAGISYGMSGDGGTGYFALPTPGAANPEASVPDYTQDTRFSVDRGFFTAPFNVAITCETPGAVIRYTTNGSEPDNSSSLYTAPLNITVTTTLRARAFHPDRLPSNTDTQTYIFPAGWITQPASPQGFPATWGQAVAPFAAAKDKAMYGMNTAITGNAAYAPHMLPALTQTLPVLCVTAPIPQLFGDGGIHGDLRRGDAEIAVGVEYFHPLRPEERFSVRGTLQAHGGAVRDMAKKGFRLDFTGASGDGPLRFPLFAGSTVETFDQLVLRPGGHDSYAVRSRDGNLDANDVPFHASYLRDQFLRRTETEAGLLSPRGRYVHLCLNGLYWGLYDLHERPNAEFCAAHAGGKTEAWDVLHHSNTSNNSGSNQVVDGTGTAWASLQSLCTEPVTSIADYLQLTALLGPEPYIDHLLIRMWGGDHDWLGPVYAPNVTGNVAAFNAKNWYAVRDTRAEVPEPWRFFTWDGEVSMGNHLLISHLLDLGTAPPDLIFPTYSLRKLDLDLTGIAQAGTPAAPWNALRSHPEFRMNVADRAQRLLFNGGVLSPAVASARAQSLISELDLPIVAETARWGAVAGRGLINSGGVLTRTWNSQPVMTRDVHWRPEVAWIRDTFTAQRGLVLRNQLRARGMFPSIDAPEISLSGNEFTLTVPAGTIYYTLNGTDPRAPLSGSLGNDAQLYSGPIPVPGGTFTVKARVFSDSGEWSTLQEMTFSTATVPTAGALAITEVHYHPSALSESDIIAGFTDADQFEFMEITNVSTAPVALASLRFAAGIDFDFAVDSAVTELAAGASLVLVSDPAAFAHRFGDSVTPAGSFQNGTRLSNSGERIKLITADGTVIAEFSYDDDGTWPAAADGGGHSLELLAPFSGTSEDDGDHWRSDLPSPGSVRLVLTYARWLGDYFTAEETTAGLITAADADPDADGLTNLIEYYTRLNPRRPSAAPLKIAASAPGSVRFIWERRADATGVSGSAEVSRHLDEWTTAGTATGRSVTNAPTMRGTVLQTIEYILTISPVRESVRLRLTQP